MASGLQTFPAQMGSREEQIGRRMGDMGKGRGFGGGKDAGRKRIPLRRTRTPLAALCTSLRRARLVRSLPEVRALGRVLGFDNNFSVSESRERCRFSRTHRWGQGRGKDIGGLGIFPSM